MVLMMAVVFPWNSSLKLLPLISVFMKFSVPAVANPTPMLYRLSMSAIRFSLVKLFGMSVRSSISVSQSMPPDSDNLKSGAMDGFISRKAMSENDSLPLVTTDSNCIQRLFTSVQIFIR